MTNTLFFKAETLKPVMMDVKNNGGGVRLVGAEGIYLTARNASYVAINAPLPMPKGLMSISGMTSGHCLTRWTR